MQIDNQSFYSDNQLLVVSAVSTNIIDHGTGAINTGLGTFFDVYLSLDEAADAGTADETYIVELQTSSNEAFTSPITIGAPLTIDRGSAAGTQYAIPLPNQAGMKRYSRLSYTLGGTTPSLRVTAFLTPRSFENNRQIIYPAATVFAAE